MFEAQLVDDDFITQGFQEWLGWQTTLDMAIEVAYEHGDIVRYKTASDLENSALYQILKAAYNSGALNMGILLQAIPESIE